MNPVKVFGHRSPDTDATCSAIVWSWFLKTHRNTPATPYVLSTPNTEAAFVLERWEVPMPETLEGVSADEKVSIVDTNNVDELFENINECEILSIIDHHKLTGGIKTTNPPEVIIQPYASTMTVMFNIMNIEPEDFPREIAGLMLSGILSDTLAFHSPTTTADDQSLAESLARYLGVDIGEYSSTMFEAKSDISHFSSKELLRLDSKVYEIQGRQMRVSVLETTRPEIVLERQAALSEEMIAVAREDGVADVLLFVIDIIKQEATFFIHNEDIRGLIEKAFEVDSGVEKSVVLPGVVSRKKQIIPKLEKC